MSVALKAAWTYTGWENVWGIENSKSKRGREEMRCIFCRN